MSDQDPANTIKAVGQQARTAIAETADTVKELASDASTKAQEFTRQAGRQATAAAETVYGASGDVLGAVQGAVRQYPWSSLLLAAAAGYGMAYLIKGRPST